MITKGRVWLRVLGAVLGACLCVTPAALGLSAGRVYEMVSPIYKGGYGVVGTSASIAPNGESVSFNSQGGFAGILSGSARGANFYLAHRGASGWSTESQQPPFGEVTDFSENMEYTLAISLVGPNAGVQQSTRGTVEELQVHSNTMPNTVANWELTGVPMTRPEGGPTEAIEEGASGDLCHMVIGEAEGPLLQEASNTTTQLYDLSRGCDGEAPSLRLVALDNSGALISPTKCSTEILLGLPAGASGIASDAFNAIADDGREIFFSANQIPVICTDFQVFVRLNGSRTLEVSRPFEAGHFAGCGEGKKQGEVPGEVPCPGAKERASSYFAGASEDGSRVFFMTTASLTKEDTDGQNNLYMATIGCPESQKGCEVAQKQVTSLIQVSHGQEPAEVQGVVRIAPDGSHAYFVARGVLTDGANAEGQKPTRYADNLYMYDTENGRLTFIADLCSGPEISGASEDVHCPRDLEGQGDGSLWKFGSPEAQTGGAQGSVLVFSTYAQLLAGDTDNAKDIYRYDAQTGLLERVSVGEAGADANGNCDDTPEAPTVCDAMIQPIPLGDSHIYAEQEMRTRAISADGSRIVFTTAGALSSDATNGLENVYEWDEGRVSLVSSGTSESPDRDGVIDPDGRDIFFTTSQGLVSQDTDGALDIYDARLGGGFSTAPVTQQPCSGDACQGPLTNPAPLLVPGSVSQASGENLSPPEKAQTLKPKKKVSTKKKVRKKKKTKKTSKETTKGKAVRSTGRGVLVERRRGA